MTAALHSVLREGQEEAYDREHARIWPDVLAALREAGIRDWTIWRSGRHLFHLVETDDFAAAMTALAGNPADQRWQQHMAAYVDHFESHPDGEAGRALRRVWRLRDQEREQEHAATPSP
jgi:L-rhamnose mutarotase